jgi:hypothetical protein
MTSAAFTASFAPTYDTSHASGGLGYWDTLQAMHERRRVNEWATSNKRYPRTISEDGWWGILEKTEETGSIHASSDGIEEIIATPPAEADAVESKLAENVALLQELQAWNEVRVLKGDSNWLSGREQIVGMLFCYSRLSGTISS